MSKIGRIKDLALNRNRTRIISYPFPPERYFQPGKVFRKEILARAFREQQNKLVEMMNFYQISSSAILVGLLNRLEEKIPESISLSGKLPLLISPGEFLPLDLQLLMVQIDECWKSSKSTSSFFDRIRCEYIDRGFQSPQLPYLLLDVEYGFITLGLSQKYAQEKIEGYGRLGLNIREVISLSTHFPVFQLGWRYIGAVDSQAISNPGSMLRREGSLFLDKDVHDIPPIFGLMKPLKSPIRLADDESIPRLT